MSETLNKKISFFDNNSLENKYKEIQDLYLSDNKPWVIGYSGGKDSTVILQLIWYAIKDLPKKSQNKDIYVISTNTLVESPFLLKKTSISIKNINLAAKKENLCFKAKHIMPKIEDSFWVNLLGKGYPTPTKMFRWCTERIKIKPADNFILNQVAYHGEVVLVLGVRKEESTSRAQSMELYKIKNTILSRHSKYPQALVYTPIEDFSIDDVWSYLLQKKNPWGDNNRDLLALYKDPNEGECPLIIDKTTPSCGNSRFGCWTCTLVKEDKSLNHLIERGETWLKPLQQIRTMLYVTTDPDKKKDYRELKGRSGQVRMKNDGLGVARGPYKLSFLKLLLRQILEAQKKINQEVPQENFKVILNDELKLIREYWIKDKNDWNDSLPKIYYEIMGEELNWNTNDWGLFSEEENKLLNDLCENYKIPFNLITNLLEVERQSQGMTKRSTIMSEIDRVIKKDWRTDDEILKSIKINKG
jgi:DNA sulfur modification protein DndC